MLDSVSNKENFIKNQVKQSDPGVEDERNMRGKPLLVNNVLEPSESRNKNGFSKKDAMEAVETKDHQLMHSDFQQDQLVSYTEKVIIAETISSSHLTFTSAANALIDRTNKAQIEGLAEAKVKKWLEIKQTQDKPCQTLFSCLEEAGRIKKLSLSLFRDWMRSQGELEKYLDNENLLKIRSAAKKCEGKDIKTWLRSIKFEDLIEIALIPLTNLVGEKQNNLEFFTSLEECCDCEKNWLIVLENKECYEELINGVANRFIWLDNCLEILCKHVNTLEENYYAQKALENRIENRVKNLQRFSSSLLSNIKYFKKTFEEKVVEFFKFCMNQAENNKRTEKPYIAIKEGSNIEKNTLNSKIPELKVHGFEKPENTTNKNLHSIFISESKSFYSPSIAEKSPKKYEKLSQLPSEIIFSKVKELKDIYYKQSDITTANITAIGKSGILLRDLFHYTCKRIKKEVLIEKSWIRDKWLAVEVYNPSFPSGSLGYTPTGKDLLNYYYFPKQIQALRNQLSKQFGFNQLDLEFIFSEPYPKRIAQIILLKENDEFYKELTSSGFELVENKKFQHGIRMKPLNEESPRSMIEIQVVENYNMENIIRESIKKTKSSLKKKLYDNKMY